MIYCSLCLCKKADFPNDSLRPACSAGRVDVLLCASSCLPPPPAHTARLLIGGNQQEERLCREIRQIRTDQPTRTATTDYPSTLPKILRPLLSSRLWGCGQIKTNLRTLLPHFKKSHLPPISRKYSAEDIGVRMAAYKLVLIRHGESCWNQENRFCGWFDADLSETGEHEAKRGGQALKGRPTR